MNTNDDDIRNYLESSADSLEYDLGEGNDAVTSHCNYCTESQFSQKMSNSGDNELSFLHFNVCSMQANFDKLNVFLRNMCYSSTIIGISETWLSSETEGNVFSLL